MLLTTTTAWATITGSGTSTDPYVISSVSDWNTAAQNSTYTSAGVYVALGADLNLGGNASNNSKYFGYTCQMHFDGRGHTISGFYLDKSGSSYIALFPTLGEGGTITNLTVVNSTIIGFKRVGGIVGRNMGTISNCHVESTVTIKAKENESAYCGGIAGENGYTVTGTVTNCTVGAKFELYDNNLNEHYFGGIVGYNYKESPVSGCLCYSTNVTSGTTFKCLIGKSYNSESVITNNYYRPVGGYGHGAPNGTATAVRAVGGIPEGVTSPAICVSHGGYAYIAQNTTFTLSTPAYKAFNNDFSVSGTGASFTLAGNKTSATVTIGSNDATVNASLRNFTYTVVFNGNNNTGGSMSNQAFEYSVSQNLTTNAFSRTGYTYNGWNTQANGTGTSYTNGQSVKNLTTTDGGSVTLYAQWTAHHYSVRFNGNGSTSGSMSNQGFTYDVAQNLTNNAFSRAFTVNYEYNEATGGNDVASVTTTSTYNGWATTADGAVVYTDQQSVSNLTPTNNGIVDLYAKWTDGSVTLPTPTKTGYTFAGWYSDEGLTVKVGDAGASYKPSANKTPYAKWTPITYTITYYLNGGSVATANPTSYNIETATITLNNPTKTGYTFAGWYTNDSFTGTAVTTIAKGSTGNKNFYAQWTLITYTIAYDLNGGSVATANPTTYNVETETFTLNNPTKPGYTFTGWTGSNGETPATTVTIEKGSTENRTYTANYEITHFTEGDLSYECTSGTEVKVTACNSSATSVTIPATVSNDNVTYNVTAINADAFSSCTSLLALILNPATPTSLGSNALDDCTALNAIGVPAGTAGAYKEATNWVAYSTKIFAIDGTCGANVYYSYDSSTTTLRIFGTGGMTDYSALEAVPWYSYLANIATVVIGNGVTGIGARAFKDCTGLASVTIPASVTSIDDYAFSGSGLTSVTIPNSMTSIGYSAFSDCTSLTSIEIPASVTSIGYGIFSGCNDLTSISVASGNSTYHSDGNCIIETATKTLIQGCKTSVIPTGVMGIGNYAFGNFTGLTSVDIPDGVTSICDNAFSGCDALTSVTIPNSVTSIGGSAFYGCTGLTSVTIPASVTSISDNAFLDCTSLASVTIYAPSPLGYGKAFGGNAEGRKIYVPSDYIDNYKNDYDWKRNGYADVTEPIIDGSCGTGVYYSYNSISKTLSIFGIGAMTSHPWTVLSYSGELTTVVVSDGVTSICDNAFAGCSSLASVFIDAAALTTYGTDAFSGNASGREIYVPTASVADYKTGWNAYAGDIVGFDGSCGANVYYSYDSTSKTLSIFGTGGMRDYDYSEDYDYSVDVPWYSERENITKVVIGDGVTSIGGLAFAYSTALTSVTIPTSVTSICDNAFHGCTSLTSVEIPANVTSIDGTAFMGCTSLASVTIYAPSPVGYRMAFENNAKGRKIYVFSDCIDDYKNDDDWITYGYADATEPITLTANESDKSGEYWTTYYNELANAKVSSGAQAFKVTLSGTTLALTEINDGIISRGEAVVIKSTSANVQPEYSATESSDTKENDLKGTMTSITNPGNAYVLNKTNENGVGFYKLSSGGTIGAHKAYLIYDGALAREIFTFDEATGISRPTPGPSLNGGEWYDLSGRKLDGKPTKKGIYVNKGHKVVVK